MPERGVAHFASKLARGGNMPAVQPLVGGGLLPPPPPPQPVSAASEKTKVIAAGNPVALLRCRIRDPPCCYCRAIDRPTLASLRSRSHGIANGSIKKARQNGNLMTSPGYSF